MTWPNVAAMCVCPGAFLLFFFMALLSDVSTERHRERMAKIEAEKKR